MSLIEPLDVLYSSGRATRIAGPTQKEIINGLYNILLGVGWTVSASLKATCDVQYGIGFPIVDGGTSSPKRTVGCAATPFLQIGAATYQIYDPGRESPDPSGTCTFVPLKTTAIDSINSLAGSLSNSGFVGTVEVVTPSSFILHIEAIEPGPNFNFIHVQGDGRWAGIGSNAGNTAGGGYEFQSVLEPETTQYKVQVFGFPTNNGNITLIFELNGTATFWISEDQQYEFIANGFGFLIHVPGDSGGSYPFDNRAIFAMAPKMPASENFNPSTQALFVVPARSFEFVTYWYGQLGNPGVMTALDGPPVIFANSGGWPRLLCYRAPGPPLLTPVGKPIVIAAYVMFGNGTGSGAEVIGKLWDCAVVTDEALLGGMVNGQRFATVSSMPGGSGQTASALLMFAPNPISNQVPIPDPEPVPPITPPVYPNTQPSTRSGTAIVQSVGFVVEILTGDVSGLQHLSPITIAGAPYLVDSISGGSVILTSIIFSQLTPVTWTVP